MVIRCELVLLSYPGASEVAIVKESWYRKVGGKGRRGISFAWRQHRFFFIDFSLLLALSYDKPEETGKGGGGEGGEGGGGGGVRARGWREAHRVRFTPVLSSQIEEPQKKNVVHLYRIITRSSVWVAEKVLTAAMRTFGTQLCWDEGPRVCVCGCRFPVT